MLEEVVIPILGAIGRTLLWIASEAIFHAGLLFSSSKKKDKKFKREEWRKTRRVRRERALKGLKKER